MTPCAILCYVVKNKLFSFSDVKQSGASLQSKVCFTPKNGISSDSPPQSQQTWFWVAQLIEQTSFFYLINEKPYETCKARPSCYLTHCFMDTWRCINLKFLHNVTHFIKISKNSYWTSSCTSCSDGFSLPSHTFLRIMF